MLTAHQQHALWEQWLGAEIRAYYFADLSYRYQQHQTLVTWLLLVSSSGVVAALLAELPTRAAWVRLVLACLTTLLSFWSLVAHNQKNVTDCADLHFRWNTLAHRSAALWNDMYAPDAARTLDQLQQIAAEISKSSTAFPYKAARMGKWQDLVEAHHRAASAA
jgi:hypothetical protein